MFEGISAVDFRGNLVAANGANFTGRLIKEESGSDGWDSCTAKVPDPSLISPGDPWPVEAGNTYSSDLVGVSDSWITWSQQYAAIPCAARETQYVLISCRNSSDFVKYASNPLAHAVTATTFSVTRGNATLSKPFP